MTHSTRGASPVSTPRCCRPTVLPHKPYLRYHDFGGTIGGPVWIPKVYQQKDKTFFFFSEEAR